MNDEGLKPCPFCGGKPNDRVDHDHSTAWIIECITDRSCPIYDREIWGETKRAVFTAWNTRSRPA